MEKVCRILSVYVFVLPQLPVWVHTLFESLAYATGFALYNKQRTKSGDFLPDGHRSTVIVAAVGGAAVASKVLGWFEHPSDLFRHWHDFAWLLGGKTIVGGLLGGTIAVEMVKRHLGIARRTGDLFAVPLVGSIAVGRVGCFLAGLKDQTFGNPTGVAWAVDFGDGVGRHPAQIYEIAFLLSLVILLRWFQTTLYREGDLFRLFLFFYMSWRLVIDTLKPGERIGPLTAIQWACLGSVLWYLPDAMRIFSAMRFGEKKLRAANG